MLTFLNDFFQRDFKYCKSKYMQLVEIGSSPPVTLTEAEENG